jgi:hypothetical protein
MNEETEVNGIEVETGISAGPVIENEPPPTHS